MCQRVKDVWMAGKTAGCSGTRLSTFRLILFAVFHPEIRALFCFLLRP